VASTTFNQFGRKLLIVLNGFLAVTAVMGGIGLLTGLNAPPAASLKDSIFSESVPLWAAVRPSHVNRTSPLKMMNTRATSSNATNEENIASP